MKAPKPNATIERPKIISPIYFMFINPNSYKTNTVVPNAIITTNNNKDFISVSFSLFGN